MLATTAGRDQDVGYCFEKVVQAYACFEREESAKNMTM
jgi:hypothetical protein